MAVLVFLLDGQCCLDEADYFTLDIMGDNMLALHHLKVDLTERTQRATTACLEDLWHI